MSSFSSERGPERTDVTDLTIGNMQQPTGESGIEIATQSSEAEILDTLAAINSDELDALQKIATLEDELVRLRNRRHSLTEALRIARDRGLE